ncbi:hypothetical protein OH76DRAFT_1424000 [Lentinus brumalis]|uniref:Uncharacterized protein n=1 Tax=Lentinus brumalis TaxID=2498619 RepID=A0A371CI29_9APHY|nr:hypothetical protein OH76DRAFT_1424000 [Polyporus brumalis]
MPMLPSSRTCTICPAVLRRSSEGVSIVCLFLQVAGGYSPVQTDRPVGAIAQSSMSIDNHTVLMSATLGLCRNISADVHAEPQQTAGSSMDMQPSFEWWIICSSFVG